MESFCCMTGPFGPGVHSSAGSFCPTTSLKMIIGIGLMSFTGAWVSGEEGRGGGSGVTSLALWSPRPERPHRRSKRNCFHSVVSDFSRQCTVSVTRPGRSNDPQSTCALSRFGQIMSHAIQTGRSGCLSWPVFMNRTGRLTIGAWLIPPVVLPQ